MKILLGVVAVVIVGYLGWRWYAPAPTQPAPVGPARTQHAAPKSAGSTPVKQPAARPTPARAVAQERRFAPEGTFFLLQRASLKNISGVIGFAPGTKVTLVEQAASDSTVTDGQYQFKVPSSQLTNDLDLAASVAKADYTTQARITELTAKWAQEYSQQQRDAFITSEKEKTQKKKQPRPTPRASNPH